MAVLAGSVSGNTVLDMSVTYQRLHFDFRYSHLFFHGKT